MPCKSSSLLIVRDPCSEVFLNLAENSQSTRAFTLDGTAGAVKTTDQPAAPIRRLGL